MKLLKLLFIFILLISLASCGRVQIKDDPWCADAGKYGAECYYTISPKHFTLDKYHWDLLRPGQICSASKNPGQSFSDLRSELEKVCADSNDCSAQKILTVFNQFLEKVKGAEQTLKTEGILNGPQKTTY